jgi:hypothetical protein
VVRAVKLAAERAAGIVEDDVELAFALEVALRRARSTPARARQRWTASARSSPRCRL